MPDRSELIGRDHELAELGGSLAAAAEGRGGLVLVAGEAGAGKTRLAEEALTGSGLLVLATGARQEATPSYGPIIELFRSYLRRAPDALQDCGPLSRHLALLLPELGAPPEDGDRPTLFEAIRCAFETMGRRAPVGILLDDLQWTDTATLELLATLAGPLEELPILVVGVYRSDEIGRGHPLRRLRADLRRAGRLRELTVEPFDAEHTAAFVSRILGAPPSRSLAATIYDRTQGIAFFIEELGVALRDRGRLRDDKGGLELAVGEDVPLPDTVRDAVLLRAEGVSDAARNVLAVAAVAGNRFDLDLVTELAGEQGLDELIERGLLVEAEAGSGSFRHALTREALYGDVPWTRRRLLHREVAAGLEARAAAPATVAEHWLGGSEPERARTALLAAADSSRAVHAYRDAADALRRALELWPEDGDEPGRLAALAELGECAALSGDLAEATRAWKEAAEGRDRSGDLRALAEVQRRLAGIYELQCVWDAAFEARRAAANGFSASGLPGEAAAERLAAAANLQSAGRLRQALELIGVAAAEADEAERLDLKARLLGLEGLVRARLGEIDAGLASARAGLSLALAENLTGPAAETYERIGMILENASDYHGATSAWSEAFDFCQTHGVSDKAHLCLGCLAYVMRKTGDWKRAIGVCRDVIAEAGAPRPARAAALGELGLIHTLRGDVKRGRSLLAESFALAERIEFVIMRIDSAWGLARGDELDGDHEAAGERCRLLLELARAGEDSHYPVAALRWASTWFAGRGSVDGTGACAEILSEIAGATGNPEAIAALAHALGELALLDGDAEQAARQFGQALERLRELEIPLDRAETQLRAGLALVAAGERESGIERLLDAHQTARKLGARPLASLAANELAGLGERVDRRLGRRAAFDLEHAGLSRRELEVVRLVAVGHTNREIARDLFLSPRTIDMHVRNILTKLDCRSRTEATSKAAELGLLP